MPYFYDEVKIPCPNCEEVHGATEMTVDGGEINFELECNEQGVVVTDGQGHWGRTWVMYLESKWGGWS